MTTARHRIPEQDDAESSLFVRLQPALCPSEEQFFEFCRLNDELRIERSAEGEVSIMPPAGWQTAEKNAEIAYQLRRWAIADGTGQTADSSAGYILPDGAIRSPDASWLRNDRLDSIPGDARSRFLPLCPDFVIELRSPTDRLGMLQAKMTEYRANGARLGWLIDPASRQVLVYRPGAEVERLDEPAAVSGDPVLPGFRLRMGEIW